MGSPPVLGSTLSVAVGPAGTPATVVLAIVSPLVGLGGVSLCHYHLLLLQLCSLCWFDTAAEESNHECLQHMVACSGFIHSVLL
jgi:hypothetical protein